ncbi:F0F1 ATP synthase subunit delta [Microbulbifer sp. SAOS-129_SWC]|uniref:F0F1 ATP synthase subunit delta n=1 Tax=Microbulbifer sp. SAOS-129_SWC TaxID=3145235 RepID=UPI003216B89E
MELNWSTFLLEIVNFLVLVWLLKRFFYKPVQQVIARRQQGIEQRVAAAEKMQQEAQQLQQRYEGRLQEWEQEQRQARTALQEALRAERSQREQELDGQLQQQRQRAQAVAERHERERVQQLERRALEQGGEFAARLLQQGAGPELEGRLQALLVEALADLPDEQLAALRAELAESPGAVEVASAFPLPQAQRSELTEALQELTPQPLQCHFVEDPDLVAGLRIGIGAWVLDCNISAELRGFAQAAPLTAERASP